MSKISFIGSYSGIDGAQIDALMEAERQPFVNMTNKKEDIKTQQDAWKDVNTRLKSLYDKLEVLQDPKTFTSKTSKSTNDDFVTISVNDKAIDGNYDIKIEQIATNSRMIGAKVTPPGKGSELDISGSFTINDYKIGVENSDSLHDIAGKINEASGNSRDKDGKTIEGTGIRATVIDNRLVLEDTKTGDRDIRVEEDLTNTIGLAGVATEKGDQAKFTINGIEFTEDSNTIKDPIEGVTINLKKAHGTDGSSDRLSVLTDYEKTEKAIDEFIKQYNSTMGFIKEQTKAGDPEVKGSAGKLYGDSSLVSLQFKLRTMVGGVMNVENSDIKTASSLGISTFDRYGDLRFDASKFRKGMEEDPQSVINFFGNTSESTDEMGFVARLNEDIDSFISNKNGIIKTKNESFDRTLKRLNDDMDRFSDRMDKREQYYINMFSKLDVAMMQAESQMDWLIGQVNAMNA